MSNLVKQDRIIYVTIKCVYGDNLVYPACDDSNTFAKLTGKKTFNQTDLRNIRELGYEIVVKTPSLGV